MKYKPVIGLEVHVELKTKSKMFCGCSADYFGQKPNTHTCPVCLGLPGALPVPNQKAIDWCVMIGHALNCKIANFSKFDRKNYFYPDLAKGYQISQYDQPFCQKGFMMLSNGKKLGITRVHMEEDTGKLTHQGDSSLIDFNRSGVPLVEIVTEPEFENAKEVTEYLKKLQQIVRYLGVSKADMEEGNMRLEPNISLRKEGETSLPKYKVEVKNINSFRFVEKAIEFEIKRQAEILDLGLVPVQETRGWNETKNKTEPDIPPVLLTDAEISKLKSEMPETPSAKFARFKNEFALTDYDVKILTRENSLANYFEEATKVGRKHNVNPKQIANHLINRNININSVLPAKLIEAIVKSNQTEQIDENKLYTIIGDVLKNNQKAVADYQAGKENAVMFLIGQVIRHAKQKLDTKIIKEKLEKKLIK
jgi:aspartyl-tRNA(Asn)/glutamyl-tRNA(Gln) amidotransferase subunit B